MNAQAILFTFLIRYSFPCMIPQLGNEATDEYKRGIFGNCTNDDEASGQIEAYIDN